MPERPKPPDGWIALLIEHHCHQGVMYDTHLVPLADLARHELATLRDKAAKWDLSVANEDRMYAEIGDVAMAPIIRRHERVLESIKNLTQAVAISAAREAKLADSRKHARESTL